MPIVSSDNDPSQSDEDANLPVLECYNTGQGSHVVVNEVFTNTFGFKGDEMNKMLEWSGGGKVGDHVAIVLTMIMLMVWIPFRVSPMGWRSVGSTRCEGDRFARKSKILVCCWGGVIWVLGVPADLGA